MSPQAGKRARHAAYSVRVDEMTNKRKSAARQGDRRRLAPIRQPEPQREPWTPWGKWARARRERIARREREREERRVLRRRARELRRIRRRRFLARGGVFLLLGLFACGIGGLVLVLLGRPYPWQSLRDVAVVLEISSSLEEHRARWESLGMDHYRVEVEYRAGSIWCGPATIEVREGRVAVAPSPATAQHWFPPDTCDALLERLVPDNAFDWLEDKTEQFTPGQTYLRARFDQDFGHPVEASGGSYDDETPDCCWRAVWADLRPLNP